LIQPYGNGFASDSLLSVFPLQLALRKKGNAALKSLNQYSLFISIFDITTF